MSRGSDDVAEQWLELSEAGDVLASLRHVELCLANIPVDLSSWKWAIIALHNALQGAMVCHLSGTAQLGGLSKQSAGEWLRWHREREGPAPNERLAAPADLFERLHKSNKRIEVGCGAVLEITDDQKRSFRLLNSIRRDFAHFTPKGWSIELSGAPKIFRDIIDIIEMIASDGWPFRHLDQIDKAKVQIVIDEIRSRLATFPTAHPSTP